MDENIEPSGEKARKFPTENKMAAPTGAYVVDLSGFGGRFEIAGRGRRLWLRLLLLLLLL